MEIIKKAWHYLSRKYGNYCPEHDAKVWWDDDYGKMRCSVTDQPVAYEYRKKGSL